MSFKTAAEHLDIKKDLKSGVVLPLYNDFLRKRIEASKKTRGFTHFHPSAFGGCLRQMAYDYYAEKYPEKYAVETSITPDKQRIFDAGFAFHDRMQRDLGELGILRGYWRCRGCNKVHGRGEEADPTQPIGIFMPETCDCNCAHGRKGSELFEYVEIFLKSDSKYNFQGNTDGIVEIIKGDPDSRYIIDFKTVNSKKFSFMKKADEKYVVQATIYMWLTGVKKAVIYYEEKDAHNIKEYIVEYDEQLVEWIKNTSMKLKILFDNGKIPSRNPKYKKSDFPCGWCDYSEICFEKDKK